MAEVDFSNARIAPATTFNGSSLSNPTKNSNVSLATNSWAFYDASSNVVNQTSRSGSQLVSAQKQLVYLYQGTFSASGTEFYLIIEGAGWKVSNISFSSGDTYIFKIRADLICQ